MGVQVEQDGAEHTAEKRCDCQSKQSWGLFVSPTASYEGEIVLGAELKSTNSFLIWVFSLSKFVRTEWRWI